MHGRNKTATGGYPTFQNSGRAGAGLVPAVLESGIRFLPEGCLADAVIVVVFLFVSKLKLRAGPEEMGNDRADRRRAGSVEAHARRPPRDAVRFAPAAVPEPLYLTSRRALPSSTFLTRCAKRSDFSV